MAEKGFIDSYVNGVGKTGPGGPVFCAKGLPDGVFNAGCMDNGAYVDPATGKPLY